MALLFFNIQNFTFFTYLKSTVFLGFGVGRVVNKIFLINRRVRRVRRGREEREQKQIVLQII